MAYYIYKSDGTQIPIVDSVVFQGFNDTTAPHVYGVGIQIVGRNVADYVAPLAQSVLQITENFSNATPPADAKALQGQLWFEKTSSTNGNLYVRFSGAGTGGIANWSKLLVNGDAVTSVSVTTANGISGSVANPTSTPAITLTLGAITPSSVASSGPVTGSNLSGTNTGDQIITLTGDVTGTGSGSFATSLSASGVTAGSYSVASIVVNTKGVITSASNNTTPTFTSVTSSTITAPGNTLTFGSLVQLANRTIAELTALVGVPVGAIAFCTNTTPSPVPVYYNGTSWRKIFDNGAI